MRRRTVVLTAVVGVAVLAAAAVVGQRLASGGDVTEIEAAEALERFREQIGTTTAAPAAPARPTGPAPSTVPAVAALPLPGVYRYATTGFDQIDVLGGARHDYPAVTTMTVVPHDCGVRLRWDVAVERWDTWDWCLEGRAIQQAGWVGYHEFFGVAGQNDYTCAGDPRPLDAPAGTTWSMTCTMGDRTTSTFTGRVLGRSTIEVGSSRIPVLHLRYDVDVVGESTGTQTIEGWYRITDGLPVREVVAVSTRQATVIGTTAFEERSSIELLTPTPAS